MNTTRAFERLPSIAGVAGGPYFIGFDFARIRSREAAVGHLREFMKYCKTQATAPAVAVVLGEWGEGKSEAFHRYVEPVARQRGDYPYLVSASTIASSYTKVSVDNPLASVNFLAATFYAIRYEVKPDKIPSRTGFAYDMERWLQEILKLHADDKIFVFIDEFEELILEPEALKKILSGLKETINKQFKPIAEEGDYPGSVFFFVSCTPDAYSRMKRDPDIAEIFGSWARRVDSSRIELEPVTRSEGVQFLYDLLRYAYDNEIPSPMPVASSGIFHTLQAIGRGNLGALVTLFTKLMNKAMLEEDLIRVIDGTFVLTSLSDEYISIYGGSTKCVETETLAEIGRELTEKEMKLFNLVAGELKAFSAFELAYRLDLDQEADAERLIQEINRKLGNIGISNAILRKVSFEKRVSFEKVQDCLQGEMEIRGDEMRIGSFSQSLTEFEDELTYLEFEDDEFTSKLLFPWDAPMIRATLGGISPEASRRLQRRVKPIVDRSEYYYTLSDELVFRLFPTPIPVGLEFIKDRDLRLKMWRETTSRLPQLFRDDMPQALLNLVKYVDSFDLRVEDIRRANQGVFLTIEERAWNAELNTYCWAHYGDISSTDIKRMGEDIQGEYFPHLILLFHIGELTDEALEEIRVWGLEDYFLHIPLSPNFVKRVLVAYNCRRRDPKQVDERLFDDAVDQLLRMELEFDRKIEAWLEEGVESGFVVRDLEKTYAKSDKDLADTLRFYINVLGQRGTSEEIFEANQTLQRFRPWGVSVGFAADIEFPQFRRNTEDLRNNGFVDLGLNKKVSVTTNSVEERLLDLIRDEGKVAKNAIDSYFVISARTKKIVQELYLNILKYKGLVREERGLLYTVDEEEALREAHEKYASYRKLLEVRRKQAEWDTFAHIYTVKQRAERFITAQEFDDYLTQLYAKIEAGGSTEEVLQGIALLSTLIEHFRADLLPKIDGATRQAREIRDSTIPKIEDIQLDIQEILESYNEWMGTSIATRSIGANRDLAEIREELNSSFDTPITEDERGRLTEDNSSFWWRQWKDRDRYFNLALKRTQNIAQEAEKIADRCEEAISSIKETVAKLENVGQEVQSKFKAVRVEDRCGVSQVCYNALEAYLYGFHAGKQSRKEKPNFSQSVLRLKDLLRELNGRLRPLQNEYREVQNAIKALRNLVSSEKEFLVWWAKSQGFAKTLDLQVDIEPFAGELRQIRTDIRDSRQSYREFEGSLDKRLSGEGLSNQEPIGAAKKWLDDQEKQLKGLYDRLDEIWPRYAKRCQRFATVIHKTLKLVKQQDTSVSTRQIEGKCDELIRKIDQVDPQTGEARMSEFEENQSDIREASLGAMRRSLDEKHSSVLIALLDKSEREQAKWLTVSEVVQEIAAQREEPATEIERTLRSLIHKGYLDEGVAIPL